MSKLHFQPEIPLKSSLKNVFQTDYIQNYSILTIIRISIMILQLIVNEKSISNSQSLDMIKLPLG